MVGAVTMKYHHSIYWTHNLRTNDLLYNGKTESAGLQYLKLQNCESLKRRETSRTSGPENTSCCYLTKPVWGKSNGDVHMAMLIKKSCIWLKNMCKRFWSLVSQSSFDARPTAFNSTAQMKELSSLFQHGHRFSLFSALHRDEPSALLPFVF